MFDSRIATDDSPTPLMNPTNRDRLCSVEIGDLDNIQRQDSTTATPVIVSRKKHSLFAGGHHIMAESGDIYTS